MVEAQNKSNFSFGVHTAINSGKLVRFGGPIEGAGGFEGQIGFHLGTSFSLLLNDYFDFDFGMNYSKNSFELSHTSANGILMYDDPENIELFSVPISLRLKLRNKFYFISGFQLEQQLEVYDYMAINDQTGIGFHLKIGKDYTIYDSFKISVIPSLIVHALVPFNPAKNQQRFTEFAIQIGLKYGI